MTTKTGTSLKPKKIGRPSLEEAGRIEAQILDAARDVFFEQGYGAATIDALVQAARISKRTFYSRFNDKPDLFRAMVKRVLASIRPTDVDALFKSGDFETVLHNVAEEMLRITLSKHLIALHRLLLAEAPRFPELVEAVYQEGTRAEATTRIAALLKQEAKKKNIALTDPAMAAEQFMMLVMGVPQRRAMGLGKAMSARELKEWMPGAVKLFLSGFYAKK
jgi:AcrR family transcriptional regulator